MISKLFSPLALGTVTLANRICVSPMCQYSAEDGSATDWHLQHFMNLAMSGAGLVMVEATAVERRGRITHACLGLCRDAVPWKGGKPLRSDEDPWDIADPSAIAYAEWQIPEALDEARIARTIASFTQAVERAVRLGCEVVELRLAHGYVGHEFVSPLSNQRTDAHGGTRENRLRLPGFLADAVKKVLPERVAMGARNSAHDWTPDGAIVDDAVALARLRKGRGAVHACVSSGNLVAAKIPHAPGDLAAQAKAVREESGIVTRVTGLISDAAQAETLITDGACDFVAIGRAFLDDPRWAWHAADRLGGDVPYPAQNERSKAAVWPGAQVARPRDVS